MGRSHVMTSTGILEKSVIFRKEMPRHIGIFENFCECGSMAEHDLPKVETGVRFPSLAQGICFLKRFAFSGFKKQALDLYYSLAVPAEHRKRRKSAKSKAVCFWPQG